MELKVVNVENPKSFNLILGMSHFIKTVEDIHEALVTSVPNIKFGLAFCESSDKRLVRWSGTDKELTDLAKQNGLNIAAGHSFILFMKECYPINVLPVLRNVVELVNLFCATANPVQVIIAETEQGRGILGVIDGLSTLGVEGEVEQKERKEFLRKIGYKM